MFDWVRMMIAEGEAPAICDEAIRNCIVEEIIAEHPAGDG